LAEISELEGDTPKYALFFTYTSEAWDAMVEKPRDRESQARAVVEAGNGTMEAIYWMFGPHDGMCIFDAPNPIKAGAVSVAVGSTGTFKDLETRELFTQDQLAELLGAARECRQRYEPPGRRTPAT
jgi:uncharacterized protein with GYD domain